MATQTMDRLPSIHPGEILSEEFLEPLGITQYRLAKEIGVDPRRIHAIVHGERGISAETALVAFALLRKQREVLDGTPESVRPGDRRRPHRVETGCRYALLVRVGATKLTLYQSGRESRMSSSLPTLSRQVDMKLSFIQPS